MKMFTSIQRLVNQGFAKLRGSSGRALHATALMPRNKNRWVSSAVVAAIVLILSTHPAFASEAVIPGELVFRSDEPASGELIAQDYGLEIRAQLGSRPMFIARVPGTVDVSAAVLALRGDARVRFAEPNYQVVDPEAKKNTVWAIGSPAAFRNQSALQQIGQPEAVKLAAGRGVVVAVLDTGVDLRHPLLQRRLVAGYDFVDNDAVAAETGSRVDAGFGHGTHVAGLVALVAPSVRIMPLRVLGPDGSGSIWNVAAAIAHAINPDGDPLTPDGAHVLNVSLGTTSPTRLLDQIVELATCSDDDDGEDGDGYSGSGFEEDQERCNSDQGVVVISAAGNGGSAEELQFPAAEAAEGALAVAATSSSQRIASFSNSGPWIGIAAPGEGITSTVPGGGYGVWSGTSMAAPLVSGVAALLREMNPDWKPVDITKRLLDRSEAVCGSGIREVDAFAATADFTPEPVLCE